MSMFLQNVVLEAQAPGWRRVSRSAVGGTVDLGMRIQKMRNAACVTSTARTCLEARSNIHACFHTHLKTEDNKIIQSNQ